MHRAVTPSADLIVGDCRVVPGRLTVLHRDGERSLPPKALAVLLELARQPGQTVSRDALLDTLWRDSDPTPDALTHAIKELRRALGDDPREPRYVETVPRVGYRLMVDVREAPPEAPGGASTAAPIEPQSPSPPVARNRWRIPALAALALAVLASAVLMRLPPDVQDAPDDGPRTLPVTSERGWESMASLSPDAGAFAYMAAAPRDDSLRIYVRAVGAPAARPLSQRERSDADSLESAPAWSNDGRRIAYARFDGRLPARCRIVVSDVFVNAEREVGECEAYGHQVLSWSHRDRALLVSVPADDGSGGGRMLARIPLDGGEIEPLRYSRAVGDIDVEPRMSPDGRWLAFRRGANPYSDVYLMPADGGEPQRLTDWSLPISRFAWWPDSSALVVARHDQQYRLRRVAVRAPYHDSGSIDGAALPEAAVFPSVARHERALIFTRLQFETRIVAIARGASGGVPVDAVDTIGSSRSEWDPAIAPDGHRLAFVSDRSGAPALYVADLRTAGVPQLVAEHASLRPRAPRWSADGRRLGYVAQGPGASHAYVLEPGDARPRRIGSERERVRSIEFAADGALWLVSDRDGGWNLWRVDGEQWQPQSVPFASRAVPLADGRAVLTRVGDPRLYLRDADGSEQVLADDLWLVDEPAWSVAGRTLCALRLRSRNPIDGQHVDCIELDALHAGWQPAFAQPESFLSRTLSLAADGRTVFSVEQERREADLYLWSW